MNKPYLGFGLGLRKEHYQAIIDTQPALDFLEILSENYLIDGGKPLDYLDKIRQDYPMVMHGVSMSLGSVDPINKAYLNELKLLIKTKQGRSYYFVVPNDLEKRISV